MSCAECPEIKELHERVNRTKDEFGDKIDKLKSRVTILENEDKHMIAKIDKFIDEDFPKHEEKEMSVYSELARSIEKIAIESSKAISDLSTQSSTAIQNLDQKWTKYLLNFLISVGITLGSTTVGLIVWVAIKFMLNGE